MHQYALKICKSDLPLITLLNDGVEPLIEKQTSYLVITIEDANHSHNEILTERELFQTRDISSLSPLLLKLKK